MEETSLYIKNMVCNRCIRVVREEISQLGYTIKSLTLGKANISGKVDEEDLSRIRMTLEKNGFELIEDKNNRIINEIKTIVIDIIHYGKEIPMHINLSDFIAKSIGYNYSYLSKLFSQVEGITIEKYIINQKIEKAKELLVYDELSLKEISYQLKYSSVQHLSNKFKRITGLTPYTF